MNIVNKVTLRQLKENKRRTIVTIVGVIISVAMLTAVATIAVSFIDLLKRGEIASNGEWHVKYKNVDEEQISVIEKDSNIESTFLSKNYGFSYYEEGTNEYSPYMEIVGFDETAFTKKPIELREGRLPKTDREIIVPYSVISQMETPYKIGDVIQLNIGERAIKDGVELAENVEFSSQEDSLATTEEGDVAEHLIHTKEAEFTVVGIMEAPLWENLWKPSHTALTLLDMQTMGNESVDLSIVMKKVKQSIFKDTEELAKAQLITDVEMNYNLLRYYGAMLNDGLKQTLMGFAAIIMVIIMIGSISLIYNAFAISVAERSRYLGMLSSVGATKGQKRNSVFFEGTVIGLLSIPMGIIAGIAGIGITFYFVNRNLQGIMHTGEKLTVVISTPAILLSIAVSILTIFISTYIPARRASKITAIDAIRQSDDIKLSNKAVKTSKLTRKLFGVEAEIGLKNLKRNKRKYQATVVSLVVSIVLFLSVSYFIMDLKKAASLTNDMENYDLSMMLHDEVDEQLVKQIGLMDKVTDMNVVKRNYFTTAVPMENAAKPLQHPDESNYLYGVEINIVKDEYLQAYAKEIGADFEQLKNSRSAILIENVQYPDDQAGKYVETKVIDAKVGDTLALDYYYYETNEYIGIGDVTIAAFTNKRPVGVDQTYLGQMTMIISEEVYEQLEKELPEENHTSWQLYMNSTDPSELEQEINDIPVVQSDYSVFNKYELNKQDQQIIIVLSIFTYGFITLITLISVANILNTISTSIALRKREFAMLKSMGMTPKGFSQMIRYESIFYGLKALLYGLPLSLIAMFGMYKALSDSFSYQFTLPWIEIIIAVVSVFVIVSITMLYSTAKLKKENIIDALKQENI